MRSSQNSSGCSIRRSLCKVGFTRRDQDGGTSLPKPERERRSKDISDMPFINSSEGQILTVGSDIIQRWLTYFEGLLKTVNTRKQIESGLATEGPIDIFNENEVSEQLGKMGLDEATGPDDLPIEPVKILAKQDIVYVVEAMNQVLQQGIPEIWRKSRMVQIYKGKGDILECSNYRGIKLMCHSMKLWERLIEARCDKYTPISPGKIQGHEQRAPHGLRRSGEGIRPSTPESDMVVVADVN